MDTQPRRLIFLGPPGAGKGTQASKVAHHLHVPHISTGAMLRQAIKEGTDIGLEAQKLIHQGLFVSDQLVLTLLAERLTNPDAISGFVLDGFPRTTAQAESFEDLARAGNIPGAQDGHAIDIVVLLEVPEQEIVERLAGRRSCPGCQASYHINAHPPLQADVCDRCQTKLTRRKDDDPDTVSVRFNVYREKTAPLVAFYEARNQLARVDCTGASVDAVTRRLYEQLGLDQEAPRC